MDEGTSHHRHKSNFSKGITLEQYLRGMEVHQDTLPTADSNHPYIESEKNQENLYRTSHQFYNPNPNFQKIGMKEIEEQHFQDSFPEIRESSGVVSTHLQNKKPVVIRQQSRKNYRIRRAGPSSCGKPTAQFSPYKTFTKKLNFSQKEPQPKPVLTQTFNGRKFELRKSEKNLKFLNCENEESLKRAKNIAIDELEKQVEKVDVRVETLKERLQKKKGKKRN